MREGRAARELEGQGRLRAVGLHAARDELRRRRRRGDARGDGPAVVAAPGQRGGPRRLRGDAAGERLPAEAAEHALADLDEGADAARRERLQGVREAHGARRVAPPEGARPQGPGGDAAARGPGVDLQRRREGAGEPDRAFQIAADAVHERRVVGVRRAHARRLAPQARDDGRDAVAAPGEHRRLRGVDGGDPALRGGRLDRRRALRRRRAHGRHAALDRGLRHQRRARRDDAGGLAAREGPGLRARAVPGAGRRELAERVAEHGVGRHAAAPQQRVEGHLHGEERGLRVARPVQDAVVDALRLRVERRQQVRRRRAEVRRGRVERLPEDGLPLVESAAHVGALPADGRVEESDLVAHRSLCPA